jgi:transposase
MTVVVQGGTTMTKPELSDELWTLIEPLIPVKPRRVKYPGRKPRDHRACLAGILFVLFTGIPWEYLPREFGCCGMTCWRPPGGRDWQQAGAWEAMHRVLLNRLQAAQKIDWSRAVVDSATIRAVGRAN